MPKNKKLKKEADKKPVPAFSKQGQEAIRESESQSLPVLRQTGHHLLSISLILIISIAIYSNTLKNGFVFDDEITIVNNTMVKNFSNISKLVMKEYFSTSGEMSYRPVVTLTYFIDYAIYGLKPYGYHLTNLILHAINGVILYIFITLLFKPSQSSSFNLQSSIFRPIHWMGAPQLLISLLFITHPVLTEAVNAISFREDLLCFLFYISALILYIKLKDESSKLKTAIFSLQLLALSFYLLALLSKEMAITFPLIIYLYEWIYNSPTKENRGLVPLNKGGIKGVVLNIVQFLFNRYTIGYIAITIFYLYLRFYLFLNPSGDDIKVWSLYERLMTIPYLILKYLLLLIAPVSLSADYVIAPIKSLSSPVFIFLSLLLISLFIMTYMLGRKDKNISFGIFFFFITLIPVYNIFPLFNPLAERYLYLPLTGFILVIFSIIQNISGKYESKRFYIPIFFIIIIISIHSLLVVKRNVIWMDNYSLWYETAKMMPENSRAHNNLGNIYFKQGRLDEAINEYLTALKLDPYTEAYKNLGIAYSKQGRLDEAIKAYLTALKIRPDDAGSYFNLGFTYFKQGLLNEAIRAYQTVLRLRPNFIEAHYYLALTYFKQGRLDEAIKAYQSTLKLIPDDVEIHYNLGIAYWKKGLEDEAYNELEIALKLNHDYLPAKEALEALRKR